MSNQRKGKYQSRPDVIGQDMNMLKFFKTAQKVLERENKQDEAFNFEQMLIGYNLEKGWHIDRGRCYKSVRNII